MSRFDYCGKEAVQTSEPGCQAPSILCVAEDLENLGHLLAGRQLARKYPRVQIDPNPIFVRDGNIYTSAGVAAGMDLALALVEEDHGSQLAVAAAVSWCSTCGDRVASRNSVTFYRSSSPGESSCGIWSMGSRQLA